MPQISSEGPSAAREMKAAASFYIFEVWRPAKPARLLKRAGRLPAVSIA
jgi:hypothetical protein